ncbi:MAG: choice-of-anchor P family protein [Nocardioides sp.]
MRRPILVPAILALVASGALVAPGTAQAATTSTAKTPTHFAFKGSGFGTRHEGGQVPASSNTTAYMVIGCTNKAGIQRENHEVDQNVPGLGMAENVTTKLWTVQNGGVVSSYSTNSIERITLASTGAGTLEINGIKSLSRAFHDASGYHTSTSTQVASITLTPDGGAPQDIPVPTPGQPVDVPGVATIKIGGAREVHNGSGANASANTLDITTAAGSRTRVAHTNAQIYGGVTHGLFQGFSSGTHGQAAQGNTTSGYTPIVFMPCQGTNGKVQTKSLATSTIPGVAAVTKDTGKELGIQGAQSTHGYEIGSIAKVDFADSSLLIKGIVGQANVSRDARGHVVSDIKGSTIGSISFGGQEQQFPDTGVLNIPGVAKLERNVVHRYTNGISVIALRVTLLDGSGAVLDLGEAHLKIKNSGN